MVTIAQLLTLLGFLFAWGCFGAIPWGCITLICGIIKQKIKLGLGGFFACMALGFLALPVCAVFVALIFKKSQPQ